MVESIPSRQKRRVYDITNVLEGIGLIEKYSKNSIRWKLVLLYKVNFFLKNCKISKFFRGGGPKTNSAEAFATLTKLKSELEILNEQEICLNEQICIMQMNKKIILEEEESLSHTYLTFDDLNETYPFKTQSLIVAKLNHGTIMEVPEPMYIYNNSSVKQKYQVNFKSSTEAMDVYLINKEKELNYNEFTNKSNEAILKINKEIKDLGKCYSEKNLKHIIICFNF